jgi:UDP-glucuronate 4-epimerase
LSDFIAAIEAATGKVAVQNLMDIQQGDVPATWANTDLLKRLTGFQPATRITDGIQKYVNWYRSYYS